MRTPRRWTSRPLTALAVGLAVAAAPVRAEVRTVADWPGDLGGPWQHRELEGTTDYRAVAGAPPHLRARAEGTASCLYREIEIDLEETPWIQWSWRVEQLPAIDAPETAKAGDDYGARIYLVRDGLLGRWSARALNYVWSQRQPSGSSWPNAYAERAVMWSVEHGAQRLGQWRSYTRNVRRDWATAFDRDIDEIDGVVIMTDADDSASVAVARYGTIRFCATRDCAAEPASP